MAVAGQVVIDLSLPLVEVDLHLPSLAALVLLDCHFLAYCLLRAQAESPHTLAVLVAVVEDTEVPRMEVQRQELLALSLAAAVVAVVPAITELRRGPAVLAVLVW